MFMKLDGHAEGAIHVFHMQSHNHQATDVACNTWKSKNTFHCMHYWWCRVTPLILLLGQ